MRNPYPKFYTLYCSLGKRRYRLSIMWKLQIYRGKKSVILLRNAQRMGPSQNELRLNGKLFVMKIRNNLDLYFYLVLYSGSSTKLRIIYELRFLVKIQIGYYGITTTINFAQHEVICQYIVGDFFTIKSVISLG